MTQQTKTTEYRHIIFKDWASILIGGYILIGTYLIKYCIDTIYKNELTCSTTLFNTKNLIVLICISTWLLSSFTLYYFGRKASKRQAIPFWNKATRLLARKYSIGFVLIISLLYYLKVQYHSNLIPATFLISYALLLVLLSSKARKDFLILPCISCCLGLLSIIIPSYWYSSLLILGISNISYGIIKKE